MSVNNTTQAINLFDETTGEMKSTYQVFEDIYKYWNNMNSAEQQSLALSLAGKNQFEVFSAVMTNFSNAVKATETALNSEGSAARENARYMESLEAKLSSFKSAFEELALDVIDSNFVSAVIELGTQILKIVDAFDALPVKVIAVVTSVTLLSKLFTKLKTSTYIVSLIKNIKQLVVSFSTSLYNIEQFAVSILGLNGKLTTLLTTLKTFSPLAITAAIGAIMVIVNEATKSFEKYSEAVDALKENQEEIENLENSSSELTDEEQARLGYLKLQTEELKKQVELKRENVLEDYGLGSDVKTLDNVYKGSLLGALGYADDEKKYAGVEQIKSVIEKIKYLASENKKLMQEMKDNPETYEKNTKAIKENEEAIAGNTEMYSELWQVLSEANYDDLTDAQKQAYNTLKDLFEITEEYTSEVEAIQLTPYQKALQDLATSYTDLKTAIEDSKTASDELLTSIKNMTNTGDAIENFGDAIKQALEDAGGTFEGTDLFWTVAENVLSSDKLGDFETAYKAMANLQSTAEDSTDAVNSFYNVLYNNSDKLKDLNVVVEKSADGLISFGGISYSNLSEVADVLGVTTDYLSAMLDEASKYSDIDLWDNASLENFVKELKNGNQVIVDAKGNIWALGDTVKSSMGMSEHEWSEFSKQVEALGVKFITTNDNADILFKTLIQIDSQLGEIDNDKITLNVEQAIATLLNLGYTTDDVKSKLLSAFNTENYEFIVNGEIITDTDKAEKAIDDIVDKTDDAVSDDNTIEVDADTTKADIELNNLETKLNKITSKTYKVKIGTGTSATSTSENVSNLVGRLQSIFSKAEGGESKGGTTLVNEEGAELIWTKDGAYIAGNGLPSLTKLNRGDFVYTAEQTKKIFNNNNKDWIMSRASGTQVPASKLIASAVVSEATDSDKSSLSSSVSDATEEVDELTEAYENLKESFDAVTNVMEHEIAMAEYQGKSYTERIALVKKYQAELHREAEAYRELGTDTALEEARKLQEEWWSRQGDIVDILQITQETERENYEFEIDMLEHVANSEETRIEKLKELQDLVHQQAEELRKYTTDEAKSAVKELSKLWWDYQDEIESIYNDIKESAKEAMEELIDDLQNQLNVLSAEQKVLQWYAQQQQDIIDSKIDALNAEKEALEERNELQEESNELMEYENKLAQAKAKKVKVYRAGIGFVYESDVDEVSEAQAELSEYRRKQEYENELAIIEDKISAWEDEKEEWAEVVTNYADYQDKLETEQTLGMTYEEFINNQRISNLESFKNSYKSITDEILSYQKQINDTQAAIDSGDYSAVTSSEDNESTSSYTKGVQSSVHEITKSGLEALSTGFALTPEGVIVNAGIQNGKTTASLPIGSVVKTAGGYYFEITGGSAGNYTSKQVYPSNYPNYGYASGTSSVPFTQFAKLNENGSELIIPPNMNYLTKGTGVVPKTLTDNLMEIGKVGLQGLQEFVTNETQSSGNVYNFDQLVLPNVENANQFVEELKTLTDFKNLALQNTYKRM